MLWSVLKGLRRVERPRVASERRLHIGGQVRTPGWEVLNALAGPAVDHAGNANDLSRFEDRSFAEVYASHILEHLDHKGEMQRALREWFRVLVPGGRLCVSVPDLALLGSLLAREDLELQQRFRVIAMIFGGHDDAYDYHKVGFDVHVLRHFLEEAGFAECERVDDFGLFDDTSRLVFAGAPISLNMIARRPHD
jgi:predicted SAM-dependent methyltransferase